MSGTGSHRLPDDPIDAEDVSVPAGRTGRRRAPDADSSVVEIDRESTRRRSRVRKLAPLGIGGAAVLAAALVFTLLQPGAQDPDLANALLNDSSRRSVADGNAIPGAPTDGGARLSDVTQGATNQMDAAKAAAEKQRREAAAAAANSSGSSGSSHSSGGSRKAAPAAGAAQVAGDGTTAGRALGWAAAGGDEFTGGGLGSGWTAYDGAGHDGQGRRTPSAVSVENGNLVIRGDSQGNTGGIAWGQDQQYGKWEMRAKFPKGDKQYHPVLLLWPQSGDGTNGEVDFSETNSAADDTSFFLHYGGGAQKTEKKALDIAQWHNYAVEITPNGVRGYIDGVQWFSSTDPGTFPSGPVHPTIQLDYFPDGGSPQPSEMQVAWMRQYN
ncbi:glycoside hydrolase family 16 protein [Pseudonocardia endophytica]|uniref:glycoside hydrolase family 16 protein n=1 Tax=Pseudonocardia endophytica TaxID=401976 RepID=UPI0014046244|nr:glycoside hydrolase family 16 protein [Pseudonocardia endophytica]